MEECELSSARFRVLTYRITLDGKPGDLCFQLGIRSDDTELGQEVTMRKPKVRSVDETYRLFGAHSVAINRANEAVVPVKSPRRILHG
jgi:hypothetical protein